MTQFTVEQVEDGSQSVYVISPSGRYLTENSFTGSYDLVEEPTSDSIFIVEDLEDNFVSNDFALHFAHFALHFAHHVVRPERFLDSVCKY